MENKKVIQLVMIIASVLRYESVVVAQQKTRPPILSREEANKFNVTKEAERALREAEKQAEKQVVQKPKSQKGHFLNEENKGLTNEEKSFGTNMNEVFKVIEKAKEDLLGNGEKLDISNKKNQLKNELKIELSTQKQVEGIELELPTLKPAENIGIGAAASSLLRQNIFTKIVVILILGYLLDLILINFLPTYAEKREGTFKTIKNKVSSLFENFVNNLPKGH